MKEAFSPILVLEGASKRVIIPIADLTISLVISSFNQHIPLISCTKFTYVFIIFSA